MLLAIAVAAFAWLVAAVLPLPAVALALIFGLLLSRWGREPALAPGLQIAVRPVLRVGVALLGASITVGDVVALGWGAGVLILSALAVTLLAGSWLGIRMGQGTGPAIVSAGAVAICGASASLAIAAALPAGSVKERDVARTLAGITLIGSAAMLVYPLAASAIGLAPVQIGILLGGSLHEVAQAVAAGFMVSDPVGEAATIAKMLRVACMGLVVIGVGLIARRGGTARADDPGTALPPLVPGFLIAFVVLAMIASAGLLPQPAVAVMKEISRLCLLVAIAGLGLQIAPRDLFRDGLRSMVVLSLTSLLLVAVMLAGLSMGVGA